MKQNLGWNPYSEFRGYADKTMVRVSDKLLKELDKNEYDSVRKEFIGRVTRHKGICIDSLWSELTFKFPEWFTEDLISEHDRFMRYIEVFREARRYGKSC